MTDGSVHLREITSASLLTHLDPYQKHFVYPIATYTIQHGNKEFLQRLDRQNCVPGKTFDVNSTKIYVDIMPYGGKSVNDFINSNRTLTPEQAVVAINNLVEGLAVLHKNDIVHGDNHEHNALIYIDPDGAARARWVDFSELKGVTVYDKLKMQKDVKRMIQLMRMIISLVPGENEMLDTMSYEMGKMSAPMSGMELQAVIQSYLTTVKKRSRSSSSTRGTRVAKKITFALS